MLNDATASEKITPLEPSLPKGFVKAPPGLDGGGRALHQHDHDGRR